MSLSAVFSGERERRVAQHWPRPGSAGGPRPRCAAHAQGTHLHSNNPTHAHTKKERDLNEHRQRSNGLEVPRVVSDKQRGGTANFPKTHVRQSPTTSTLPKWCVCGCCDWLSPVACHSGAHTHYTHTDGQHTLMLRHRNIRCAQMQVPVRMGAARWPPSSATPTGGSAAVGHCCGAEGGGDTEPTLSTVTTMSCQPWARRKAATGTAPPH